MVAARELPLEPQADVGRRSRHPISLLDVAAEAANGRLVRALELGQVRNDRMTYYGDIDGHFELQNLIERAAILSPGKTLQIDTSTLRPGAAAKERDSRLPAARSAPAAPRTGEAVSASLEDVERAHILEVLESCGWKVKGRDNSAERLGLKESTLRSRMKRLGIGRP